jgi:hypothetical protein
VLRGTAVRAAGAGGINRGNNRERVFLDEGDFRAFVRALRQRQGRYPFALFAYMLYPICSK